ncbi:MAG: hypothetical protein AAGL08_08005 [Cyanobacteria bacterium J06573_11]
MAKSSNFNTLTAAVQKYILTFIHIPSPNVVRARWVKLLKEF